MHCLYLFNSQAFAVQLYALQRSRNVPSQFGRFKHFALVSVFGSVLVHSAICSECSKQPAKQNGSFRSQSLEGVKIISFFIHHINRWPLQAAECYTRFHPQLLVMLAPQNSNAEGAAMRLQSHTLPLMSQDRLVLHLFMHRVVGVLTPPLHVPVWAPTRYLLSRNILSASLSS